MSFDLYSMILDYINAALKAGYAGNERLSYDAFGIVAGWYLNVDGEPTTDEIERMRRSLAGLIDEAHQLLGRPFPELDATLAAARARGEQ